MVKFFEPVKDLVAGLYDVFHDAAEKAWSLAKPVLFVGLAIDLVSGKLGWITQILEYYRQGLAYTAGASHFVLILGALMVLYFFKK
ncbi:MAG: hypothetical protein A2W61_03375 [Deltaproteobacteria bacterium RIFCSPLOWO2_01_44_7]|nr:MAG: hypothetical protein A2712_03800 [Deltaproteobacteria bacterium RIFCSPHIGHO2_01_FULL_43_49]OGQ16311.1 MAG: hypothetical protein A3D22_01770 [Deltaproteobacteria bacterium RIFCSPHIGHO2_02_FULL_44_53]OGQ29271.1 MAG: hypothetical protein A3D98_05555 [Deltaproteobacteria bacterium RIFCSPHIGHO2_12_FULL_44_21]OGQ32828.1 MAG: hypothetical protein A2979_09700 [Deltaproteobacteria bacterium RIFCSPLOWO2_01_FULL_45_74]OGQ38157.1 MAG: hypothetical protein A2W61_03375 [Deltaproteobacteria bacterium 